jgi:hypothetical protein
LSLGAQTLQLLAQWLIVMEAVFAIHRCIKTIMKIITLFFEVAFVIVCLVAVHYFYCQSTEDPKATELKLREMLHIAKNIINLLHWALSKNKE